MESQTVMGDSKFQAGEKVIVLKSRKLGNNVEAVCISEERQFNYGAEWTVKVETAEGKTLWSKISNLKLAA